MLPNTSSYSYRNSSSPFHLTGDKAVKLPVDRFFTMTTWKWTHPPPLSPVCSSIVHTALIVFVHCEHCIIFFILRLPVPFMPDCLLFHLRFILSSFVSCMTNTIYSFTVLLFQTAKCSAHRDIMYLLLVNNTKLMSSLLASVVRLTISAQLTS